MPLVNVTIIVNTALVQANNSLFCRRVWSLTRSGRERSREREVSGPRGDDEEGWEAAAGCAASRRRLEKDWLGLIAARVLVCGGY